MALEEIGLRLSQNVHVQVNASNCLMASLSAPPLDLRFSLMDCCCCRDTVAEVVPQVDPVEDYVGGALLIIGEKFRPGETNLIEGDAVVILWDTIALGVVRGERIPLDGGFGYECEWYKLPEPGVYHSQRWPGQESVVQEKDIISVLTNPPEMVNFSGKPREASARGTYIFRDVLPHRRHLSTITSAKAKKASKYIQKYRSITKLTGNLKLLICA